ncbi:SGNH/GDSL hydrolase family protein [Stenotrophomonas cyclobalanopsidis]|uniref:SGNH/GDSL hydrolase family protein n=1 Tax=Stenotrophomonas cyclobalanopsidis TaxID=2771362 RepID=UPI002FDA2AE6
MTSTYRLARLAIVSPLLVACSSQVPSADAAAPIDATTRQILIEEYGDSTTVGYTVTPSGTIVAAMNQPNTLQRLLRQEFGDRVVVKNEGVGGIQSSDALNGTDGIHRPWESVMATSHAQIVTLNFGLGDAYLFSRPEPGKISASPQEYKRVMGELVRIARKYGKTVVVHEPNPSCHPARENAMQYYVMHLDQLGHEQNIPIVSQFWALSATNGWRDLLSDCTHPQPELYQMKGENAYSVIRPIVGQLASQR